jgi:hypothetical protein
MKTICQLTEKFESKVELIPTAKLRDLRLIPASWQAGSSLLVANKK